MSVIQPARPPFKLTDGPADTDLAPSPDGSRAVSKRKARHLPRRRGQLWVLGTCRPTVRRASAPAVGDPGRWCRRSTATIRPRAPGTARTGRRPGDRSLFSRRRGRGIPADRSGRHRKVEAPAAAVRRPHLRLGTRRQTHRGGLVAARTSVRSTSTCSRCWNPTPVATGTNAGSVDYADLGRSIVFANADATGTLSPQYLHAAVAASTRRAAGGAAPGVLRERSP